MIDCGWWSCGHFNFLATTNSNTINVKFEPQISFDQKKKQIELYISKLGCKIFKELKSLEKKKQIVENQDSKILLLS